MHVEFLRDHRMPHAEKETLLGIGTVLASRDVPGIRLTSTNPAYVSIYTAIDPLSGSIWSANRADPTLNN